MSDVQRTGRKRHQHARTRSVSRGFSRRNKPRRTSLKLSGLSGTYFRRPTAESACGTTLAASRGIARCLLRWTAAGVAGCMLAIRSVLAPPQSTHLRSNPKPRPTSPRLSVTAHIYMKDLAPRNSASCGIRHLVEQLNLSHILTSRGTPPTDFSHHERQTL